MKDTKAILAKLGIRDLNAMQREATKAIRTQDEVILLSPTGTGKTLAFLLPIIEQLRSDLKAVQAVVVVPSRELAAQIEQVARGMGSGHRILTVYGGHSGSRQRDDLKTPPALLIGTPGRLADHLRREAFSVRHVTTLVLDEFDKSLETGFEKEMKQLVRDFPHLEKKILTSATQAVEVPDFLALRDPITINYLGGRSNRLRLVEVIAGDKDKLAALEQVLALTGSGRGIIFCNFKDTVRFVSDFLTNRQIDHGIFMGGLEQTERERSLIRFRNGTHRLLLATDLAARGIDVPELDFIVHYQLPPREDEFTHRNGRTARMHANGTAYVLRWSEAPRHDYLPEMEELSAAPNPEASVQNSKWTTLYVSAGRKDKVSKGDLAGLFFKQGGLAKGELGVIELLADCAFVSVPRKKADGLIALLDNGRVKKRKVRVKRG